MAAKPPLDPSQPIHWILDWDGTITRRDTLDALVSIAAKSKPDSPVLDEWKRVSEAYMSDYMAALDKLAPGGDMPKTIQEEKKLLRSMKQVEQRSLDRVSESGIFRGLTRQLLDEGAKNAIGSKQVEIRNGFAQFLRHTENRGSDSVHLLSVNWSRHFMSSCLRAADTPVEMRNIFANELNGIGMDLVSNGKISPDDEEGMKIISSDDKLEYMEWLCKTRSKSSSPTPTVYVGDSWTDIECLLGANLGICIRDDPIGSSQKRLAERLQSLDVRCPRLRDWREADSWQVVWASDFAEILAWVEGKWTP
jgi:2-hydroxy-3-keto-5-methylthiopentenyl-1-phosphate phosphatase